MNHWKIPLATNNIIKFPVIVSIYISNIFITIKILIYFHKSSDQNKIIQKTFFCKLYFARWWHYVHVWKCSWRNKEKEWMMGNLLTWILFFLLDSKSERNGKKTTIESTNLFTKMYKRFPFPYISSEVKLLKVHSKMLGSQ